MDIFLREFRDFKGRVLAEEAEEGFDPLSRV